MTRRAARPSVASAGHFRRVPASEWWRTEGTFYLLSEGDRAKEAPTAVDFLERAVPLAPGSRVLDLGCGYGRITLELARRGHRVVGVDISPTLAVGRELARRESVNADFVRADLRAWRSPPVFDLAVLWGMTFGYFSDEENLSVLQQAVHSLRPGGALVLDLHQREWYIAHYLGEQVHLAPGGVVHDEVDFDPQTGRLSILSTLATGEGVVRGRQFHAFREYTVAEMTEMARTVGLTRIALHPNLSTRPGAVTMATSNWQLVGRTPSRNGVRKA